jgi:hypothetical protein
MMNFSEVESSVLDLKKQVAAGEIDQQTFEARLLELVDVAPDGYYWMYGHKTESWYQHDGQQWIKKDPSNLRLLDATGGEEPLQPEQTGNNGQSTDLTPASNHSLKSAWQSVNWVWFIASLIAIAVVSWIVYASSLF